MIRGCRLPQQRQIYFINVWIDIMMDTSEENFDIMRLKNNIIQVTLSVGTSDIFYFSFSLNDFSFGSFSFDLAEFWMIVDKLLVRSRDRIEDIVFDQEDRRKRIKMFRIRFFTFPGPVVQFWIKEPYPEGQLITDSDATWPLKEYVKNTVGSA